MVDERITIQDASEVDPNPLRMPDRRFARSDTGVAANA